jgi:hypothetical protein
MPENRYSPPGADLSLTPVPPRAPWPAWRAVLAGLVVDIGGTTVAGLLIGVVWYVVLTRSGVSAEQIHAEMSVTDRWTAFVIVSTLVGAVFSYLGGFVCNRLAQRADLRLGFVLAALSLAIGFWMSSEIVQPAMFAALSLLTAVSALAGARAGRVVPKV